MHRFLPRQWLAGLTVRRHIDCLIAAIAIDYDVELLHSDHDVDAFARTSALRIAHR